MTTTPQEPGDQDDPQSRVHRPPDEIPSSEETVTGDVDPEATPGPDRAPDPGDTEQDLPGVDPTWRQHAQEPAEGPDDPELPS